MEVHWLRLCLPMQVVWFPSLVEELRAHMPHGQKKKTTTTLKQKQYCNKFNKHLKMVHMKNNL